MSATIGARPPEKNREILSIEPARVTRFPHAAKFHPERCAVRWRFSIKVKIHGARNEKGSRYGIGCGDVPRPEWNCRGTDGVGRRPLPARLCGRRVRKGAEQL